MNCKVDSFGSEPWLIKVGKDCLFADGVRFITHDGGVKVLNSLNYFGGKRMDRMARIDVGNNVYIGTSAMIMPGVEIGNNVIIGAYAVVTHDIPDNVVAVGMPARVIKTVDEYYESAKEKDQFYPTVGMSSVEKREYYKDIGMAN